jgi:hypothetical protein
MAHFLKPQSNVRISGSEQVILMGRFKDVGVWGGDFSGKDLAVTSSSAAVKVERKDRKGEVRIWRITALSTGEALIEARTTSPPVSVWDAFQVKVVDESWPPKPSFAPLVTNAQREQVFGKFRFQADPRPGNPEHIKILGNWVRENIADVQLDMGPNLGVRHVQFHKLAAFQLRSMWAAWGKAGLLDLIKTNDGFFVTRFVRGSTTHLSNHSFGTAFDINARWNPRGRTPATLGDEGSVRELVPIANRWGFFWGGHYTGAPLDGMHFEVAKVMALGDFPEPRSDSRFA